MISDRYQLIFVHIPKCGGTSFESIIWDDSERTEENLWMGIVDKYHNKYQTGGLQHLKSLQIRHCIGRRKFDDYFKFALVRNPFSKAVSQFKSMSERRDLRKFIGMKKNDNFLAYLEKISNRSHVQWEQQVSFIYDYYGNCLVDYVGKFEEIDLAFKDVAKRVGLHSSKELPHINKSNSFEDYRSYYCEKSRALVEDMYKEDIDVFGYSFAM